VRLFKRTLPPAATPISFGQIVSGIAGLFKGNAERERFRSELKDYFGVKHCFLVSSGKAALTLILEALHELNPDRNAVIIPAFTCYSVPSAVKHAGLGIKLCDIDPDTLDFDYSQLERMLRDQPEGSILAIIPRHIFGIAADIDRLHNIVQGAGISVVEDAAQTMGGERGGKKLGVIGDAGIFSLGRGKAFSTVEGGVILTGRDDLGVKISKMVELLPEYRLLQKVTVIIKAILLSLSMRPSLFWIPKSLPFLKVGATIYDPHFEIKRLSGFQAGIAKGWVGKLRAFMAVRELNANQWAASLRAKNNHFKLFRQDGVDSEHPGSDLCGSPVRFPVVFGNTLAASDRLRVSEDNGLGVMITYPDSVNGIPELSEEFVGERYPVAREYAGRMLTFPTHCYVTDSDRDRIIESLKIGCA
jgi:perosamine synthetase